MKRHVREFAFALSLLAAAASPALSQEIKLGITGPLSGPAAGFAPYVKGFEAYFADVNTKGGIGGRQVQVTAYDDEYAPPKTLEMTRRLVERDGVLAIAGSVGTANAVAVQRYLNGRSVPQTFVLAGAPSLNDPATSPWTSVFLPTYDVESKILVADAVARDGQGRFGLFFQDDDAGRSFRTFMREELGARSLSEQSYTVTDVSVDSQITALRSAGATTVFLITTPRHTALALRRIKALGWSPNIYITSGGSSVAAALVPAGVENALGVRGAFFRKVVGDPRYDGDADVKDYTRIVKANSSGIDPTNDFMQLGYVAAAMTATALRQAAPDITRESLRREVANFRSVAIPLLLPGISATTSAKSFSPIGALKIMRFDGTRYITEP